MEQIKKLKINGKEYTIQGDKGDKGDNGDNGSSVFIRYSAYADGTDYTAVWQEGQCYLGVAMAKTKAPELPDDYEWMFVGGGNLAQTTGDSATVAMSQKAVTEWVQAEVEDLERYVDECWDETTERIGDISTALDAIIAIQNSLIGGDA